jgi:hypothetical protein
MSARTFGFRSQPKKASLSTAATRAGIVTEAGLAQPTKAAAFTGDQTNDPPSPKKNPSSCVHAPIGLNIGSETPVEVAVYHGGIGHGTEKKCYRNQEGGYLCHRRYTG